MRIKIESVVVDNVNRKPKLAHGGASFFPRIRRARKSMSMEVSGVSGSATYNSAASVSSTEAKASEAVKPEKEVSATYEKSDVANTKATYSINKMSAEDRAALVSQLKADQQARQSQFTNLVADMLNKQGKSFANATDMWKILASGDFTVDAATKAQAQADISEDGYWGVKQTSQRLFDFASALAGDDVEKMKEMQEAMMKGFKMATGTWGRDLPEISHQTIDAANKLFEDYYASKNTVIEE